MNFRRMQGLALTVLAAGALTACNGASAYMDQSASASDHREAPPGGGYEQVSDLVPLPEFIPGMGTLYVQPETLPAGPFLGYDRGGQLVHTTYMVPLDSLNAQEAFTGLETPDEGVEQVDLVYNSGHAGVEQPHYHIVLWHVSPDSVDLD